MQQACATLLRKITTIRTYIYWHVYIKVSVVATYIIYALTAIIAAPLCSIFIPHSFFFLLLFLLFSYHLVSAFSEKCNATAGNSNLTTHLARSHQLATKCRPPAIPTNTFFCNATNLRIFSSNNVFFA